jgi:hypothetical protein
MFWARALTAHFPVEAPGTPTCSMHHRQYRQHIYAHLCPYVYLWISYLLKNPVGYLIISY